jgi:hypothetical protein
LIPDVHNDEWNFGQGDDPSEEIKTTVLNDIFRVFSDDFLTKITFIYQTFCFVFSRIDILNFILGLSSLLVEGYARWS